MSDFSWSPEWIFGLTLILLMLYGLGLVYRKWKYGNIDRFTSRKKKAPVSEDSELERSDSESRAGVRPPSADQELKPTKKRLRLSKAIADWFPLLQKDSKDPKEWERVMISSDLGPKLTKDLIAELQGLEEEPKVFLKRRLKAWLDIETPKRPEDSSSRPWTVFVIGVNGAGKTTSIVKLAHFYRNQGKSVAVIAADTFRKAAVEQLQRACDRHQIPCFQVVREGSTEGADPASVVFDGLKKFREVDIVLVDTSGRLHNKKNLMEELKKMQRVAEKALNSPPQEKLLVIDASLGQNAVQQAESFHEAVGVTGIMLTKLDGLSRGGSVFQMVQSLRIPVRFLGTGESVEDLREFRADEFVDEMFDQTGT
ncbi:MAG: signal recognition particle-docking protein FtsY [Bradymonadales bacterium]|nr:MAG: signal recognition particle-docking protein FtsY [Bradymonadales bacterium]